MNPQFKKEEIKYFKNFAEIQLGITKVVLEEHRKRKPCECDCDIKNLEKVQEIQQRIIDLCNTVTPQIPGVFFFFLFTGNLQ